MLSINDVLFSQLPYKAMLAKKGGGPLDIEEGKIVVDGCTELHSGRYIDYNSSSFDAMREEKSMSEQPFSEIQLKGLSCSSGEVLN